MLLSLSPGTSFYLSFSFRVFLSLSEALSLSLSLVVPALSDWHSHVAAEEEEVRLFRRIPATSVL